MPAQPRDPKNLGTKIMFKILGKPQNMQNQDSKKEEMIDKRLSSEETRFVR